MTKPVLRQTEPERAMETGLKMRGIWDGFEREFRFDRALPTDPPGYKPRRFRADLRKNELLIELDGGIWTGGRHVTGKGVTSDAEKMARGTLCGYRWLRFTTQQVRSGFAADVVEAYLSGVRAHGMGDRV